MGKIELTPEQAKQLYLNINAYYLHIKCAENIDKVFFKRLKFWNPTINNHLTRARKSVEVLLQEFDRHFAPKDSDIVQYELPAEMYRVMEFFANLAPDTINEIMTQLEEQNLSECQK